jgi:hypothetical protein
VIEKVVRVPQHYHGKVRRIAKHAAHLESVGHRVVHRRRGAQVGETPQVHRPVWSQFVQRVRHSVPF